MAAWASYRLVTFLLASSPRAESVSVVDKKVIHSLTVANLQELLVQYSRSCDDCGHAELVEKVHYLSIRHEDLAAKAHEIGAKQKELGSESSAAGEDQALARTGEIQANQEHDAPSRNWIAQVGKLVKESGEHVAHVFTDDAKSQKKLEIENLPDDALRQKLAEHGRICKKCQHDELVEKVLLVSGGDDPPKSTSSRLLSSVGELIADTGDHIEQVWGDRATLDAMANAAWEGFSSSPQTALQSLWKPEQFLPDAASVVLKVFDKMGMNVSDTEFGRLLDYVASGKANQWFLKVRNACALLSALLMFRFLPKMLGIPLVILCLCGDSASPALLRCFDFCLSDVRATLLLIVLCTVDFRLVLGIVCNGVALLQSLILRMLFCRQATKQMSTSKLETPTNAKTFPMPIASLEVVLKGIPTELLEAELSRRKAE